MCIHTCARAHTGAHPKHVCPVPLSGPSTHLDSPFTASQAIITSSPWTPGLLTSGLAFGGCHVTTPIFMESSLPPLPSRWLLSQVSR